MIASGDIKVIRQRMIETMTITAIIFLIILMSVNINPKNNINPISEEIS